MNNAFNTVASLTNEDGRTEREAGEHEISNGVDALSRHATLLDGNFL